jgi:hypothetical protein
MFSIRVAFAGVEANFCKKCIINLSIVVLLLDAPEVKPRLQITERHCELHNTANNKISTRGARSGEVIIARWEAWRRMHNFKTVVDLHSGNVNGTKICALFNGLEI